MTSWGEVVEPLHELRQLAGSSASGEFIAVDDAREVHVFLHRGRVAWGTTNEDPFAFKRHLVTACGVRPRSLAPFVEACRVTRVPLARALVSAALLTEGQVREAVLVQARAVFQSLARCEAPRSVFLRRGAAYAAYDSRLTFDLSTLLAGEEEARP